LEVDAAVDSFHLECATEKSRMFSFPFSLPPLPLCTFPT
jgi:hypothetical protein